MKKIKTIRGKLLVYFLVFAVLFQLTAILIFVSSNKLTSAYDDSFQRFLTLNSISQKLDQMFSQTQIFASERNQQEFHHLYQMKYDLLNEKEKLLSHFSSNETQHIENYANLIDTFILENELTAGFVLRNDIEQYTYHLDETRNTTRYIREATLELMNTEMTEYQKFYDQLKERNKYFGLFIIFLFSTTIILAIMFALWFSRDVTRPIYQLAEASKEVSKGNFIGKPLDIQSNDEFKLLGDTFNRMRSDIHHLVQEIKDQSELDKLIKDMEMRHLQNQIHPHFLFNTLNTLSKMAYLEDANSTSSLIDSVAGLLRHSLGDINKQVFLRDEIEMVKNYFHIQKVRFSDRVTFQTDIDDTCLDIPIPRLSLQPLVENAFIHGIENREEGGVISVHIYQTNKQIIVEVKDNGVGMSSEKVHQILSMITEGENIGHSTGLGLRNVIRRLQIFYQTKRVVDIQSEKGIGTSIRLLIPKIDIEGEIHESCNCRG